MNLLIIASALLAATVTSKNLEEVYSDEKVVTAVSFDGLATTEDLENATPTDYETVKSNAASALSKAEANEKALVTKANANDVYKKTETYSQTEIDTKVASAPFIKSVDGVSTNSITVYLQSDDTNVVAKVTTKGIEFSASWTQVSEGVGYWVFTPWSLMWTDILTSESDPTVPSWAKAATKPTYTASEVSAYSSSDGASLANRVTTAESSIKTINSAGYVTKTTADAAYYPKASGDAWSSYWDGDDVRVTVTNYDSVAHLPSLYLEQRTNSTASASSDTNAFRVVWRELAHWDAFLGSTWNWEDATWQGFDSWRTSLSSQLDEKADRAWGFYDSHTGEYAPDGYTSISSSNVMICAGASYQKTATATCDVWVLTANEPYEATGVSTNGGFQIKDADGNVKVEIVKGDKHTVKAQAGGVSVTNSTLYVVYNVVSSEAPTGEVCLDLSTAQWKAETDSDCPATVTWSGSSGAWVAAITPTTSTTRCFFKATYVAGGEDYINNHVPVALTQLVIGGKTYTVGTATIDGNTVLTLTPAN